MTSDALEAQFSTLILTILPAWALRALGGHGASAETNVPAPGTRLLLNEILYFLLLEKGVTVQALCV